jgi:hypothetical protein
MNPPRNEDKISEIMNDSEKVRAIIQSGINDALLKPKQAGNPVCGWKDGNVFWVEPENIPVNRD